MKKHWLEIAMIVIFIIKIWIVSIQPIYVKGQSHDDMLFAKEATSLVRGDWLGEYDDMTLSKGMIAVLFIAIAYKLGVSYLLAQQILYFLACISVVSMLKNVIHKKRILLLCYIILLWNPISYSDAFSFVYRDGVYTSLILFFVAFSFQIFFHYKSEFSKVIWYSIAFGITFAAIYLCREETLWLFPYLLLAIVIIVGFILGDKECMHKWKRILYIIGIPVGILVSCIIILSSINYQYYGRFITNDFTSKDFKDAYGALTRIKQENYIKRVPLNEETRRKLYELSPRFQELEGFLENQGEIYKYKRIQDYQEGFLYWAVREAAYRLGYYENAKTAEQFYIDLANEINELCDSGQIESYPKRSSLIAPFQTALLEELQIYIPKTFRSAINL